MDLRGACVAMVVVALGAPVFTAQDYKPNLPVDHPRIRYRDTPTDEVGALLTGQGARPTLDRRPGALGVLPALLARLRINPDSQMLVFSKTSVQAARISPTHPRAIYFNDTTAVAYVPGSPTLEIAAVDAVRGPIFYTLSTDRSDTPVLVRGNACLRCHQGPNTAGVPGLYVGSVIPGPDGAPLRDVSAIVTDHRSPFEERWGGWFVTAAAGEPHSRANAVAPDPADQATLVRESRLNLESAPIDPSLYLSTSSDIVALMTFEHQTQMINLLTRVGWEARMEAPELDADVEETVRYMLFADEEPIEQPIAGHVPFARSFAAAGPRDRRGRSLRELDLRTRLFRYPLSYMVYSPAFDALPAAVRQDIYRRVHARLTGSAPLRASAGDRRAVLEILRDTKSDLPADWMPAGATACLEASCPLPATRP